MKLIICAVSRRSHWYVPSARMRRRVTVVGLCVCVCLCVCLLSHISPLEHLFVLKILSRTQRATEVKKFVGFSLKPLRSRVMAWNASERANMLIRSSLLWLTRDQVFLFEVQRSTCGYCMREYKHGYCSGQTYSASSSVQNQPWASIARAFPAFAHARYIWDLPRALSRIRARTDAEGSAL